MAIRILIPRGAPIHRIIHDKYVHLHSEWVRTHPGSNAYTLRKMRTNVANAYAISRMTFPETAFKLSQYAPWVANGWYEVYYSHWYFAVTFAVGRGGIVRAVVQDAIYEGDHHNDIMTTKPYESKTYKKSIVITESKLRHIITESVRNVLNRLLY